jgi:inosine/xanthosine triphosphatase
MRVAVGSRNPVKVAAVERALPDATVEAVGVDSGVPDQPWGHAETRTGAENRARRALAPAFDLGVGIEGGVARYDDTDGLFLVMWAAVADGDRLEVGVGPGLRLPDAVADRVESDEELGPVMDDVVGDSEGASLPRDVRAAAPREGAVKRDQGAAGVLTDGIVDRESCLRHAVAGALGPFRTDHYEL